jgi:RNA polymerase sigma-70 factor (ECF subfamily)
MVHSNADNEQLLFRRIAAGDECAFRQVFELYNGKLFTFILRLTKSKFTSAELIQDIFVKLWINRSRLARVGNPHAYIFAMASNRTMDHLRRVSAEAKILARMWQRISIEQQNSVEENFNAKESQGLIDKAVIQLSPQKQKIFRLSRYEGLNHQQIAFHLRVSKSTVKNHLVETLRHIRSYLHHHSETLLIILFFQYL